MKKIKQIFFDLEGTLSNFEKCEIEALNKTFQTNSIVLSKEVLEKYLIINSALWRKHEKGEIQQDTLLYYRFELLFEQLGICMNAKKISQQYQDNLSRTFYFEQDALLVLQTLTEKCALYLVTNGKSKTQRNRIRNAGIEKYFRNIFISEEIGFNKPQKDFFEVCFDRIGLECKSEAMIVGDSLSSDILGGQSVGIKTCWYNPHRHENLTDILCDFEITNLKQLLKIV